MQVVWGGVFGGEQQDPLVVLVNHSTGLDANIAEAVCMNLRRFAKVTDWPWVSRLAALASAPLASFPS